MPQLQKMFPETAVYICMETPQVWERLLQKNFFSPDLKKMLDSRIQKNQPED